MRTWKACCALEKARRLGDGGPFILFAVIPGRAQCKPGISRNNLWIPGSMLRIGPE
jgi:hypothetical protein